jgi:RHH-type proline utilization regulon transcriptional repressor/proline dehydrogenase/delta 1-pyrroline-5-carboxylate dehydrogenase
MQEHNDDSYLPLQNLKYRDEKDLIEWLLHNLKPLESHRSEIDAQAQQWIEDIRTKPLKTFDIQKVLQSFPLDHPQGRALMALAEAYLRIPDAYTASLLLKDKISGQSWRQTGLERETFSKVSQWGLDLLGQVQTQTWAPLLQPLTLKAFKLFMGRLSREFILGQTIEEALKRRQTMPHDRISFDMLGEGARTFSAANVYKQTYLHAIQKIGEQSGEKESLSVKLSALHPHYNFAHRDQVMHELLPILLEVCVHARERGISLTIDAEESARLELSLDVIKAAAESTELKGWDGFGLAVQAYQKCAPAVIDWLENLKTPLTVRLVKGAYWDTEIKIAQVGGYESYPVFTRKAATDLSYLICAQKLLKAKGLSPQFATHNAHTVAAILTMANGRTDIEFQRLQGMGEDLYKAVRQTHTIPCRVYAPVGKNHDLLPYLVRRLLENGANSSFVHKIYDPHHPLEDTIGDPWRFFETHAPSPHPAIPLPQHMFGDTRPNSQGYDLNDRLVVKQLYKEIEDSSPSYGTIKKHDGEGTRERP